MKKKQTGEDENQVTCSPSPSPKKRAQRMVFDVGQSESNCIPRGTNEERNQIHVGVVGEVGGEMGSEDTSWIGTYPTLP